MFGVCCILRNARSRLLARRPEVAGLQPLKHWRPRHRDSRTTTCILAVARAEVNWTLVRYTETDPRAGAKR
jgi:hypothetical protein